MRDDLFIVANKMDLVADASASTARLAGLFGREVLAVSAATGAGLEQLRRRLGELLADLAPPQGGDLLLHERQQRAIAECIDALARAENLFRSADEIADVAELAAVELRCAAEGLGQVTGAVVTEDILATIFSRFCIGK